MIPREMSSTEEKVIDDIDNNDDNFNDNDGIVDTYDSHTVIERPDERSRKTSATGLTWKVASTAKRASVRRKQ